MSPIRVLVVEDSRTIRGHIVDLLRATPGFEVAGEAGDGKTAIELCRALRPDVVTMDMMLPVMTGLAATEYIMAYCPTPILIVSASTNRGELFKTYDALAAGAVDVVEKPSGTRQDDSWDRQLLDALRMVARIRVITHLRGKLGLANSVVPPRGAVARVSSARCEVVAIGGSTGGPGAMLKILDALPATFPVPILLVIHISEPFGLALAEWLDSQARLPVRYARDGEPIPPRGQGCVLMAPPDCHLEVGGARLFITRGPERHSCRPSVDVLFETLARTTRERALACLLTGMGRDGASGMLAVSQAGGVTVAQDESTSVVFGMPGEAVKLGAVEHVLPIQEIGPFLNRACDSQSDARRAR
jgi:two-component system chemotaxis response regulator CheB